MLTLQEDLPVVIEDKRDVLLVGAPVIEGSVVDMSRLRINAEAIVVLLSLLIYLLDIYDLLSLARREVMAIDDRGLPCEIDLVALCKEGRATRDIPTEGTHRGNGLVKFVLVEDLDLRGRYTHLRNRARLEVGEPEMPIWSSVYPRDRPLVSSLPLHLGSLGAYS